MLGWFGRWKNSFTEDKARICLLIASYRCIIYFSRFIRQTLLASRAWIVGTVQIFLCDNTISDMMIHLFQNIRVSKSYQGALFCVLFQQCVVLSIITEKLSHANWCTVMSIFIMTRINWNLLLIGCFQRQFINVSRCVYSFWYV